MRQKTLNRGDQAVFFRCHHFFFGGVAGDSSSKMGLSLSPRKPEGSKANSRCGFSGFVSIIFSTSRMRARMTWPWVEDGNTSRLEFGCERAVVSGSADWVSTESAGNWLLSAASVCASKAIQRITADCDAGILQTAARKPLRTPRLAANSGKTEPSRCGEHLE